MSSLPQAEPAWLTAEVSRLPQFMSWWSKAGLVGLCSTPAETQERTNLSWVHVESDPASSKLIDRLWAYCNVLVLHVYHWSVIAGHKKAMKKTGNRLKKRLFCNFCCDCDWSLTNESQSRRHQVLEPSEVLSKAFKNQPEVAGQRIHSKAIHGQLIKFAVINTVVLPVVPHKAVAEVSKIGSL